MFAPPLFADSAPPLLLSMILRNSAARLTELAGSMRELIATSALNDAESAAYWAYHLGRTGFFMGLVRMAYLLLLLCDSC